MKRIVSSSFNTADEVINAMLLLENPEQRDLLMGFFKTGEGQYGEGDQFLGLKVPETRSIAQSAKDLSLLELQKLLESPLHEVRLCAFLILVDQFECNLMDKDGGTEKKSHFLNSCSINDQECMLRRDEIVDFYLKNASRANNWDLVDMSCYKIIGKWLLSPSKYTDKEKTAFMDSLAQSDNLWERRISMVSTLATLMSGDSSYTWKYAVYHLRMFKNKPYWSHDLMHKAVGWMLREMGKRCGMDILRDFLKEYVKIMPRTTLRYAIERMNVDERKYWMHY